MCADFSVGRNKSSNMILNTAAPGICRGGTDEKVNNVGFLIATRVTHRGLKLRPTRQYLHHPPRRAQAGERGCSFTGSGETLIYFHGGFEPAPVIPFVCSRGIRAGISPPSTYRFVGGKREKKIHTGVRNGIFSAFRGM